MLVVNSASKCGFTCVNFSQLVALWNVYHNVGPGFEVLMFPCNQFADQVRRHTYTFLKQAHSLVEQELGDNAAIAVSIKMSVL